MQLYQIHLAMLQAWLPYDLSVMGGIAGAVLAKEE